MNSLMVIAMVMEYLGVDSLLDSLMTSLVVVAVVMQSLVMDSLTYPPGLHTIAV